MILDDDDRREDRGVVSSGESVVGIGSPKKQQKQKDAQGQKQLQKPTSPTSAGDKHKAKGKQRLGTRVIQHAVDKGGKTKQIEQPTASKQQQPPPQKRPVGRPRKNPPVPMDNTPEPSSAAGAAAKNDKKRAGASCALAALSCGWHDAEQRLCERAAAGTPDSEATERTQEQHKKPKLAAKPSAAPMDLDSKTTDSSDKSSSTGAVVSKFKKASALGAPTSGTSKDKDKDDEDRAFVQASAAIRGGKITGDALMSEDEEHGSLFNGSDDDDEAHHSTASSAVPLASKTKREADERAREAKRRAEEDEASVVPVNANAIERDKHVMGLVNRLRNVSVGDDLSTKILKLWGVVDPPSGGALRLANAFRRFTDTVRLRKKKGQASASARAARTYYVYAPKSKLALSKEGQVVSAEYKALQLVLQRTDMHIKETTTLGHSQVSAVFVHVSERDKLFGCDPLGPPPVNSPAKVALDAIQDLRTREGALKRDDEGGTLFAFFGGAHASSTSSALVRGASSLTRFWIHGACVTFTPAALAQEQGKAVLRDMLERLLQSVNTDDARALARAPARLFLHAGLVVPNGGALAIDSGHPAAVTVQVAAGRQWIALVSPCPSTTPSGGSGGRTRKPWDTSYFPEFVDAVPLTDRALLHSPAIRRAAKLTSVEATQAIAKAYANMYPLQCVCLSLAPCGGGTRPGRIDGHGLMQTKVDRRRDRAGDPHDSRGARCTSLALDGPCAFDGRGPSRMSPGPKLITALLLLTPPPADLTRNAGPAR